jgi:hypothetical protein
VYIIHTDRDKKDSSIDVHASQGSDDSATTKQELTTNKNVCDEGEDHEHQMGSTTVSGVDNLEISVASWRVLFDFTSQNGEHKNLYGGSCCVPEWACNSIRVCDLEKISEKPDDRDH